MPDRLKRLGRGWSGGGFKFFRDVSVLAGGQVGSRLIGFFVFAVLARTLQPEGYGAVEYVVGLSVVFATLVDSGLGVVGVRRIAQQPDQLPVVAAQVPAARLGLALICAPLMVFVATPAVQDPARGLVWLFALSLLARAWRQDWLLQATERMSHAAGAQLLQMIVFALAVVALVRGPLDVLAVGAAEIVAVSAMSLYCLLVQHAAITPVRGRVPLAGILGLAREGVVVGLGNSVWAANQYAPLLLVATLLDGVETAWFAAASRVSGSLLAFSYVYHFNLYPAIARATTRDRHELAGILAASFRSVAWGSIGVALALTLLAEPLSMLLFGDTFRPAAPLLMVMVWIVPIALLSGHARWSLIAAGIQSRALYAQLAGLIAVIVLGVPLVMLLGGLGAALASVTAGLAVWIAAHAFVVRHGGGLPASTIALGPGALALVIIGGIHVAGLRGWAAGLGVVVFAAAAPLVDRKLLPDLWRLGHARLEAPASADAAAEGSRVTGGDR